MKLCTEDFYKIPEKKRNGIYEVENLGTHYWVNGVRHREDGPAKDHIDGHKFWYINDKIHRLDGPAIEWRSGNVEYWIKGKYYPTKEEFDKVAYMYKNGLQDYL